MTDAYDALKFLKKKGMGDTNRRSEIDGYQYLRHTLKARHKLSPNPNCVYTVTKDELEVSFHNNLWSKVAA